METLTHVSPPNCVLGRVSLPPCFSRATQEVGRSKGAAWDKAGRASVRGQVSRGLSPLPLPELSLVRGSRMERGPEGRGTTDKDRGAWRLHACVQRRQRHEPSWLVTRGLHAPRVRKL